MTRRGDYSQDAVTANSVLAEKAVVQVSFKYITVTFWFYLKACTFQISRLMYSGCKGSDIGLCWHC